MTFTQLFAGGDRLGYFASYGQRPLARTAALSGGAIDGFIMANYDSMSFHGSERGKPLGVAACGISGGNVEVRLCGFWE